MAAVLDTVDLSTEGWLGFRQFAGSGSSATEGPTRSGSHLIWTETSRGDVGIALRADPVRLEVFRSFELSHRAAVGLAVLVTFLWSTSWVLIRWGLDGEELAPLGFAAMRYGLASIVLVSWVSLRGRQQGAWRDLEAPTLIRIGCLGLVLVALTQGAQFVAIDNQPASTTSLVLSATPLLVAALSGRTLAEPPSRNQLAGGVLVTAGAALYFTGAIAATGVGMVAAVVALLANTAGSVLGRSVNRSASIPAVEVTALSMTAGATALGAVSLAVEGWPSVSPGVVAIVGWLAVVNTALAFTWWNLSQRRLSAVESAGINNTMLVQISILGWVFLNEPLGWKSAVAVALVSVGVWLTQQTRRPAAETQWPSTRH